MQLKATKMREMREIGKAKLENILSLSLPRIDQGDEGDVHEEEDDDGVDIRGGQAIFRQEEGDAEEDEGDESALAEESMTSDSDIDSDVEADLAVHPFIYQLHRKICN